MHQTTSSIHSPKQKNELFAFLLSETDDVQLPAEINIPVTAVKNIKKVSLLGEPQLLKWNFADGVVRITIPVAVQQNKMLKYAALFKIEY